MRTKKDAFYFPHDSNAKDDIKIALMTNEMGLESYGIFWVLVEILRDQPSYECPIKLLPIIAKRYGADFEKVKKVVYDYELFVVKDDEIFYSESLKRRMLLYEEKKEKLRIAGLKSAEKRKKKKENNQSDVPTTLQQRSNNVQTTLEQVNNNILDNNILDNNVLDNIKREGSKMPPTLDKVKQYIEAKNYIVDGEQFFYYYSAKNWEGIKNWQAKIDEWQVKDSKTKPPKNVKLGVGEFIKDGIRTYGTGRAKIPMDAPPRPSEQCAWNAGSQRWFTQ